MKIQKVDNSTSFQHKILIDIGASNPKGTLKVAAISDSGELLLKENSYLNNTVRGFDNEADFVNKLYNVVKNTHRRILWKEENREISLSKQDKKLSGVVIFVPGTTYAIGGKSSVVAFMPNLKTKEGKPLLNINFDDYKKPLAKEAMKTSWLNIDKDNFKFVVTKDLGGAGVALAQIMAKKDMLNEGDYIMGVMTGGGFGSVDIKVKNGIVEFETSESSSYIAGNYDVYDQISEMIDTALDDDTNQVLESYKANHYQKLREDIKLLGKLGRQGVSVKSHIATFCKEIYRFDLMRILQEAGDARIVEMNRLYVNEKDTEVIEKLRGYGDDFIELGTKDGKVAFALNEEKFGAETLKRARTVAVNAYANAVSLISINKINDCINKVVLLGPFAHGVNRYVKEHSEDFDGARDLSELIKNKVRTNTDPEHINLPSTRWLMDLYNFEVICDENLNFPDNTYAGDVFLNPEFKFNKNRGSWSSIPLKALKES